MTGAELKLAREKLGKTQEELAADLGMSKTMIGYMERGRDSNGKPVKVLKRTAIAVRALVKNKGM